MSQKKKIFKDIISTFDFSAINNRLGTNNYVNYPLGLGLKIPDSWSDLYRAETHDSVVTFYYSGSEHELFSIHKVSLGEWEGLINDKSKPFYGRELDRDDDYVYYLISSLENPFSGEQAEQADRYQQMAAEIKGIETSFKLLN